jgi:hypothetical protein
LREEMSERWGLCEPHGWPNRPVASGRVHCSFRVPAGLREVASGAAADNLRLDLDGHGLQRFW